ncbi:ABC transporter ATP-binding protein [Bacillus licheniformis]|nr:ABC transporter ATP-binding protein [Bacillus licheniformis]
MFSYSVPLTLVTIASLPFLGAAVYRFDKKVHPAFRNLIWISLGFIAVMAAKGAATFFHQYLGDMFGIRSVYRLRKELYAKLQRLPFKYYDSAKTGDLMSRLTPCFT